MDEAIIAEKVRNESIWGGLLPTEAERAIFQEMICTINVDKRLFFLISFVGLGKQQKKKKKTCEVPVKFLPAINNRL